VLRKEKSLRIFYCKMPKYVYKFTNGRQVTKREFIKWFQKKFLYTMRKFKMVSEGDRIVYPKADDVGSVVLDDLLQMFAEKAPVEVESLFWNKMKKKDKVALAYTSDTITRLFLITILYSKASKLRNCCGPVSKNKKTIMPLYLFLDKEVLLYCKLKGLKCVKSKIKKDKISKFIDKLEDKHPELKHSVVQTYLELFK